jgi:hypothetical protein
VGPGNKGRERMVRHQAAERGSVRRGLKKEDGRAAGERDFYIARKRRLARARALPDLAGAKPGGANTTIQIILLRKNII